MLACSLTDKIDNVRNGNAALLKYLVRVRIQIRIRYVGWGIGLRLVMT